MAKKTTSKQNKVSVVYTSIRSGGESTSGEMFSEREPAYTDFEVVRVSADHDGCLSSEEMPVNFDPNTANEVYVVVVRYSTGDTFGHSSGEYDFIGVFDNEVVARTIAESIREGHNDENHKDYSKYKALMGVKPEEYILLRWEGYFEDLEQIEIYSANINKGMIKFGINKKMIL
jgi:hypothetical protein